jgi:Carboxypeptidase regulatory-like domain
MGFILTPGESDSFNYTGNLNGNWTNPDPGFFGGNAGTLGTNKPTSAGAIETDTGGTGNPGAAWFNDFTPSNVYSQIVYQSEGPGIVNIYIEAPGGSGNGYLLSSNGGSLGGRFALSLFKMVGGVGFSFLGFVYATVSSGDSLAIAQNGSHLEVFHNGNFVFSADDSTYACTTAGLFIDGVDRPDSLTGTFTVGQATLNALSAIAGQIVDQDTGAPLVGVPIGLSGAATASTSTDSNGFYTFTGLAAGSYTITAGPFSGYIFSSPINIVLTNLDEGKQDFAGIPLAIKGSVSRDVAFSFGGVLLTLSGAGSGTFTTSGDGTYSFPGLINGGNYKVTPYRPGYYFTPPFLNITVTGDMTANFEGKTQPVVMVLGGTT